MKWQQSIYNHHIRKDLCIICKYCSRSELHSDQLQGLQQTQEGQHEQHLQADIGMVEQEQIFLSLQYKMNCSNSQLLLEKRRNLLKGAEYEFGPDNLKDPEEINKVVTNFIGAYHKH